MRTFFTLFSIMVLAVSCTKEKENTYSITEEANNNPINQVQISDTGLINMDLLNTSGIGDAESQMLLSVVLDSSSYAENIEHSEIKNKRKRIALADATVSGPYPEKLNVYLLNTNAQDFPNHAYRATVKLYVEDKEIESFAYITGPNAKTDVYEKVYDIMPHLEAAPGNSYLVKAECKIEWYKNVDISTLTLESDPPQDSPVKKSSNPFRVTFK